ncbi:MAG: LamG domain-containing protein [Sphingobacteriales bacterium]|jgi:hypothetical protein
MKRVVFTIAAFIGVAVGCSDQNIDGKHANLKEGLMIHLPFNGNLDDASGHGCNGTVVGGAPNFVENRFFDAANALDISAGQFVEIPDKGMGGRKTFSFYLEFYPRGSSFQVMVGKRAYEVIPGVSYNQSFNIGINNAYQLRFTLRKPGTCQIDSIDTYYSELNSGTLLPIPNSWNYLAGTYDGKVQRLYLNGVLVSQQDLPGAELCDSDPFRLGVWWKGDPFFFNGKVDEFRVYNRALSDAEVRLLYKLSPNS